MDPTQLRPTCSSSSATLAAPQSTRTCHLGLCVWPPETGTCPASDTRLPVGKLILAIILAAEVCEHHGPEYLAFAPTVPSHSSRYITGSLSIVVAFQIERHPVQEPLTASGGR
jgi:hypothetical protein